MTPIERAKSDLAKLKIEISRLRSQIESMESRRDKVSAYIEMADIYESEDGLADGLRAKGGISGAAVRGAVDAIRERKAPIHTRELLEILAKQGIHVGGSNPVANLSGFLSRSEELRNSRALGWGLAGWTELMMEPTESASSVDEESRPEQTLKDAAPMPKPSGGDLDDEL